MAHREFWKNKRVLITGFEGFLGSNLARTLVLYGAKMSGVDIRVNRAHTIFSPGDYRRINVVKGDVANYKLLKELIAKNRIQVVFHLAAEALVGNAYRHPLRAFKSNIRGTWNILEACRQAGTVEAIIVASSDKVYGSHKKLPYTEDYFLNGKHPYDVSKSCADLLATSYSQSYGLPVLVTRSGNIYGPGDFNFSRLIPDAMRCIAYAKTLKIRSDGNFIRDYIYVDDVVSAYLSIAELFKRQALSGKALNLSDESPLTVMDLLHKIRMIASRGSQLKYTILNTAKHEIKEQYLSSKRARTILGWKPRYTIEHGLQKTIAWYDDYFNNLNSKARYERK